MIPQEVLSECREKAKDLTQRKRKNWIAAGVIISIWILVAIYIIRWLVNL
jgi:hypothetical protein